MPNVSTRFWRSHHVNETRRPHESDAAYLSRLVHASSHRSDLPYLTIRYAERAHLDLNTAFLARTIARVVDAHSGSRVRRYSERLVAAAAVLTASNIHRLPWCGERLARANRLGDELPHVWNDLELDVDRLGREDRRAIFGNLEDGGCVYRGGWWHERDG